MKHLNVCLLIVLFAVAGFGAAMAQEAEAQSEIKKATEAIQKKEYQNAMTALDNAKKAVKKILSDKVAAALPQSVGEWQQVEDSEIDMGMSMGGGGGMSVNRAYMRKADIEKAKKSREAADAGGEMGEGMEEPMEHEMEAFEPWMQPQMSVTISDDFNQAQEVMMAHSSGEGHEMGYGGEEEVYEPSKLKGYRALTKYSGSMKTGSLTMIVGAAVVRVEGMNLKSTDTFKAFAEAIDVDLVKSIYGE